MLKSTLVTTANGKPQTSSSRLPFAVNTMLKVPYDAIFNVTSNIISCIIGSYC